MLRKWLVRASYLLTGAIVGSVTGIIAVPIVLAFLWLLNLRGNASQGPLGGASAYERWFTVIATAGVIVLVVIGYHLGGWPGAFVGLASAGTIAGAAIGMFIAAWGEVV
jgi:hypothetical protein